MCSEIVSSYFEYFSRQSFWTMAGQLMFKPFFQTLKLAEFEIWTQTFQITKDNRNFHQSFIPHAQFYSVNDLKWPVASSTTPRELKQIKSCSYPETVETVNINFIIISYRDLLIGSRWLWESRFWDCYCCMFDLYANCSVHFWKCNSPTAHITFLWLHEKGPSVNRLLKE